MTPNEYKKSGQYSRKFSTKEIPEYIDESLVQLVSECLSDNYTKSLFNILYIISSISVILLIVYTSLLFSDSIHKFSIAKKLIVLNISISSFNLISSFWVLILFIRRINEMKLSKMKWHKSRKMLSGTHFVELILNIINSILLLIPNAYLYRGDNTMFSNEIAGLAFARFSVWILITCLFILQARFFVLWSKEDKNITVQRSIISSHATLLDAPWKQHFILVVIFVVTHVYLSVYIWQYLKSNENFNLTGFVYNSDLKQCSVDAGFSIQTVILCFIFLFLMGLCMFYFNRAGIRLAKESYTNLRWMNIEFRYFNYPS